MQISSYVFAVLSIAHNALSSPCSSLLPIVQSPSGTYVGNASISGLDQFLGIRFAKPPVGSLRFANPEPLSDVDPKTPILAAQYGMGCSQDPVYALYNGLGEDCLTLNVIRPHVESNESLPVMVWIYGGGNENGQSIFYNGTALVQYSIKINQPVIYVAMNYRLGGFGFMSNPAFEAANITNAGLKDQYLALQWVHNNIPSFGGDLSRLIIFGESAGAANCWSQLHYAKVRNEIGKYFTGMITQSGAPGSPQFPVAQLPQTGEADYQSLLKATNCTNATDSIACLRSVPHDIISPLLVEASAPFALDDVWFSSDMVTLLEEDDFAPLPIIHGANLDEGAVFLPDTYTPAYPNGTYNWPNRSALIETVAGYLNNNMTLATNIINAYFSLNASELGAGYNSDATAPLGWWQAVAVYSDLAMHLGRRAFLKKASTNNATWGYYFTQTPPPLTLDLDYEYPGEPLAWQERVGTYHGSELPYVFGEVTNVKGATVGDGRLTETMMRAWIQFTYYSDPNGPQGKVVTGELFWPKYNATNTGEVMYLQNQGGMTSGARPDIMRQKVYDAWNDALVSLGKAAIY